MDYIDLEFVFSIPFLFLSLLYDILWIFSFTELYIDFFVSSNQMGAILQSAILMASSLAVLDRIKEKVRFFFCNGGEPIKPLSNPLN